MNNRVYYHHPEDQQYSLAYVTQEVDDIATSGHGAIVERYSFDDEFFVLYTNGGAGETVEDLDDGFDDVLDSMPRDERIITVRFLQIFEGIIEAKELEEGEQLDVYKQIELDRIPEAIGQVDWSLSAVEVAGQIMSSLILKHALPNANHRASISMAEWYLESTESGFSFPSLATEDHHWKEWVNEYIAESKRLLTVRRNTTAFSLLKEWGCEIVERRGGIDIVLSEYDLDYPRSEAFQHYAELHTELCTEFMIESVERAGYEELVRTSGPTKSGFVDYLLEAE